MRSVSDPAAAADYRIMKRLLAVSLAGALVLSSQPGHAQRAPNTSKPPAPPWSLGAADVTPVTLPAAIRRLVADDLENATGRSDPRRSGRSERRRGRRLRRHVSPQPLRNRRLHLGCDRRTHVHRADADPGRMADLLPERTREATRTSPSTRISCATPATYATYVFDGRKLTRKRRTHVLCGTPSWMRSS